MTKLLGYGVVNTTYTTARIGNINVSGSPPVVSVDKNQVTKPPDINGDPELFTYYDTYAGKLLVVLVQYDFSTGKTVNSSIYDFSTNPWTKVKDVTSLWTSINNLWGVVSLGSYLYAIDYDSATVAKISLTGGSYSEVGSYTYSTSIVGYHAVGVGITTAYNGSSTDVYALFAVLDSNYPPDYQSSALVKLDVSGSNPTAAATITTIGENPLAMTPNGTSLFIANVGGAQSTTQNSGTSVQEVVLTNIAPFMTPHTRLDSTDTSANYMDLTINGATGAAYVLAGLYTNTNFTTLAGDLYSTSKTNISSGTIGTSVDSFSVAGNFWAVLYQDNASPYKLWYARGNPIDVYNTPPVPPTPSSPVTETPANLGTSPTNVNINSVTPLWGPSADALRRGAAPPKSFRAHLQLARDARRRALELKGKKKK